MCDRIKVGLRLTSGYVVVKVQCKLRVVRDHKRFVYVWMLYVGFGSRVRNFVPISDLRYPFIPSFCFLIFEIYIVTYETKEK